jgi:hypothetical protein
MKGRISTRMARARKPSGHGRPNSLRRRPLREGCRRIKLHEFVQSVETHKVDREKGIIHRVKILGFDSVNGRRYTPEAMQRAIPLYEKIKVNIDHPGVSGRGIRSPHGPRSSYDRLGKFSNIEFVSGEGLFGDLRILKAHSMTPVVFEAAEDMPDAFGMSHNAEGDGHDEGGTFVVEEIVEVRSVDLVADAATNNTLYESRDAIGDWIMKIPAKYRTKFKKWLAEDKRAKLKKLLAEMGGGDVLEADDSDTGTSYKDHLHSAIGSVAGDDSLSADQKKAKLKKFVDMMCEDDEIEDEEDDETEDDETEDDETEDDDTEESEEDDDEEDDETEDEDTEEGQNVAGDDRSLIKPGGKSVIQGTMGPGDGVTTGAGPGSPTGKKTGVEGRRFKRSKDPAVRQLQEELRRSQLKEWIRNRCARAKVPITGKLLHTLLAMRKPRTIIEHIDYLKHNLKTESRIRSQGPGGDRHLEEGIELGGNRPRQPKIPTGGRKLANWLTS